MYSSFIHGSYHSNLYLADSKFSRIILPAIHLSNDQEGQEILRDTVFNTKKQNIDSNLTLINCKFTFCSYQINTEINGGAIYINMPITFHAKNCIFRKNEARKCGGAIYATNATLINISDCLIAENTCRTFGAVALSHIGEVIIKNTNLTLNKSNLFSGAISLKEIAQKVYFTNVCLNENHAKFGGALTIENTDIEINNCIFYFNRIGTRPASIKNLDNVTMLIRNTIFAEEELQSISLHFNNNVKITNCTFGHTLEEEINKWGASLHIDDSNVFGSSFSYNATKLDPLDKEPKENKDSKDKAEKNAESKDENKVEKNTESKVESKEKNNDPVVVKHGDKNESIVMLPILNNVEKKTSIFSFSFCVALVIIVAIVVVFCHSQRNKRGIAAQNQNNSIFNNEDLNSNADASYSRAGGERLPDINVNELSNVKMETF